MLALMMTLVLTAEAPPAAVDVRSAMHTYYQGEFDGGFAWSTSGGLSMAAAIPMLLSNDAFFRGMGWPTGIIGLAQVGLGISSFFSAPARIRRFDAQLDVDPQAFAATEQPRLRTVAGAFTVFQLVELGLVAGGSGVMGAGFARREDTLVGVGLGLVVQSLLFLVLDEVASRRADTYVTVLDDFVRVR
ncbi:MAG: hypothetical protein ABTQ32_12140 [Myxococcaceae bacterium]